MKLLDVEAIDLLERSLDVHSWANLNIPPVEKFLGELVVPGSRTFLVGTTGVGKTLIAYEAAAGIASGRGFLHWKCDRAAKVLLIDGEMPDALIKQRVGEILGRQRLPDRQLVIYSLGRSEEIENVTGLSVMPPLNTPQGHKWVKKLVEMLCPEVVFFDNLMSLAPGNHAEMETWLGVLPLVMDLSKEGLAQVWCDHSGWDASRQFGTSTKAWTFDAVGIIKPIPEDQREDGKLTVTLSFDPPGKCRRRTPENWKDFQAKTVTLSDGHWSHADAAKDALMDSDWRHWLADLAAAFLVPGLAKKRNTTVGGQTVTRVTLLRSDIREYMRKCGRIGDDDMKEPLSGADRKKLSTKLSKMRDAGKIGIDGDMVWLA